MILKVFFLKIYKNKEYKIIYNINKKIYISDILH